jgi:hypothetical protein
MADAARPFMAKEAPYARRPSRHRLRRGRFHGQPRRTGAAGQFCRRRADHHHHRQAHSPDPAYFVGSGKADEIGQAAKAHGIELVIFNHALSPAQQRNLEKRLNCACSTAPA